MEHFSTVIFVHFGTWFAENSFDLKLAIEMSLITKWGPGGKIRN